MARMPFIDPDELPAFEDYEGAASLPEEYRESRHVRENRFQHSKVWRTMAHNPEVHRLHTEFALALWNGDNTGLTPRENELIILAFGRAFGMKHEWNSHVQNALSMGVTEDEILSIADGSFTELSDKDRALVRYITAMATMDVTDIDFEELNEHYDYQTIIGIQMMGGFYALCAVVIDSYGIEMADPGEGLAHLDYDLVVER